MAVKRGPRQLARQANPLTWELGNVARAALTRLSLEPTAAHSLSADLARLGLDVDRRQLAHSLRALEGRKLVDTRALTLFGCTVNAYTLTEDGEDALDELFDAGWSIVSASENRSEIRATAL